jgi:hypothetical protein
MAIGPVQLVVLGFKHPDFHGEIIARTVGVIMAFVAALVGFGWLPWYPVWAILIVIASASVIWALTVHGRDLAEP